MLGNVKLRDMKVSRDEREDMLVPDIGDMPNYPYGLRLHLDEDELGKLGISLPDVGEEFVIVGIGTVTSVSQDQNGERTSQHVEVQLEKLAFESREETVSIQDRLRDAVNR